jgi:uncharacterized protein
MKIRLNEIPEEGRSYDFNRNTSELNEVLRDLIEANAYDVSLYIKPLNSKDFAVNGQVKTHTHEQCSRCGEDFNLPITKKIKEILIPSQEQDRTSKYAKSTTLYSEGEDEVSVSEYTKLQFDLGEFLHEAIALEVPFTPHCSNCSNIESEKTFSYDEKMGEETKPNPFQALKGIKLN